MSKVAKYIVDRFSLPCLISGLLPLLPLQMLLQQLRHHHLKVLTTDAVNTSHVQLLPAVKLFLFLQTKNDTRRTPLRHH